MRLIDADALKKDIADNYAFTGFVDLLNDFARAIDGQPTVDAVAVVRCRDCSEYRKFATKTHEWDSDGLCLLNNFGVNATDFCSDGERRETDE